MQTKVVTTTTKKIRPTSGQIPQKSISASHRMSSMNGQYDPFMNISTSVSDPTDDYGSIGNEQVNNNRAQKVHQTQKLAPAFRKESNLKT
jgi:hypothetical protein